MTAPLVLVAGSLHLDTVVKAPRLPKLDETLPGSAVSHVCGGKGGNQAVACARHGAATAFFGAVGEDAAGKTLLANLRGAGVDCAQVAMLREIASGMSVAVLTDAGDYGAVIVSAANLAIDPAEIRLPPSAKLLVLQNEIPAEVNDALAKKARAAGMRVLWNAAPARPRVRMPADILIVNRVEAAGMSGEAVDNVEDALAVGPKLGRGKADVIVTLGGEGAVLAPAEASPRHFPALPVLVASTHGAGDCFVGALAARLALGEGLEAAVGYAQAAASLHVSLDAEGRESITPETVLALMKAHR